jgi:hypothetical protein
MLLNYFNAAEPEHESAAMGLNYAPQAVDIGKCADELAAWLAQRGDQPALHTSLH